MERERERQREDGGRMEKLEIYRRGTLKGWAKNPHGHGEERGGFWAAGRRAVWKKMASCTSGSIDCACPNQYYSLQI